MDKTIGWGIIGCGSIANSFAEGLKPLKNARLAAVAARDGERARDFAAKHGFEKSYPDYEQLAQDPDVDVVYIATIHPTHMQNTLLCIENGKSVLCEKPFAMNEQQAKRMVEAAKTADIFLMEAMWTRFLPSVIQTRKLLTEDMIGEIKCLSADFGFKAERDEQSRLLDPLLGGGALLDVGIYPISFASMLFGCQPKDIKSIVEIGHTGADEKAMIIMDFGNQRFANLACAVNTTTGQDAVICGENGLIRIDTFWRSEKITLQIAGGEPQLINCPFATGLNGYSYEAMAVTEDIINGQKENSIMPLSETLEIMNTLDRIRGEWKLKYPCE